MSARRRPRYSDHLRDRRDRAPVGTSIGSLAPPTEAPPTGLSAAEREVVRTLVAHAALWGGGDDGGGVTTPRIAGYMRVWDGSPERAALNDTLTSMRRRGLLRYEIGAADRLLRWWVTERGVQEAGRA